MITTYKYRIYPNQNQIRELNQTFGCVRFLWNHMLNDKNRYYKKHGVTLRCTPANYKGMYPFLNEVDALALCNTQFQLEYAFKRFWNKQAKYPAFQKKKSSRSSYTTSCVNNNIRIEADHIRLPKIGLMKAHIHRLPPEKAVIKTATIVREKDGSYHCSLVYECAAPMTSPTPSAAIGLDFKMHGLYCDSNGHEFETKHCYRDVERKVKRMHRQLERKQYGSANYEKQRRKYAKLHLHIKNQRKDLLHKESTKITNSYNLICIENLDLIEMASRKQKFGKSLMDDSYGIFVKMLTYKSVRKKGRIIKVGKWFPSTQRCHCCGYLNRSLSETQHLKVRSWTCSYCHAEHDRDHNAAINILQEGKRLAGVS